jgi:hypothetical protein
MLGLPLLGDELRVILPSDQIVSALRDIFFCGSGAKMERALGIPRGQGNHYCVGSFPAPLHFYLRVAFYTGASMAQIFVANRFESTVPERAAYNFPMRHAPAKRTILSSDVAARLSDALSAFPPLSIRHIATQADVDAQVVWRRFPELAADVSARYAAYVAERAAESRRDFRAAVRAVVHDFGTSISAAEMKLHMADSGCYLNDWKREIIKQEIARADFE